MISVCMATYNGQEFLKEQLDSILCQIQEKDELIISDDGSSDSTKRLIQEYQSRYKNIMLLEGPKLGVQKNFENALKHVHGDIVFLSDQDDVWLDGKVKSVLRAFEDSKVLLVLHNANIVDTNRNFLNQTLFDLRGSKSGLCHNLYKNGYVGCCMAFRKEVLKYALPFPDKIEMHDWWIGLVAEKMGESLWIKKPYLDYRRHNENVSSLHHHPLPKMIFNRLYFIKELMKVHIHG